MWSIIGFASVIGFFCGLIWLMVRLIKRSKRKRPVILTVVCLLLIMIASDEIKSSKEQTSITPTISDEVKKEQFSFLPPPIDREKVKVTSQQTFHEIRTAFEANEIAAKDKYKGKTYTLVGMMDGISESGLNKVFDTVTVTIKIKDGDTNAFLFASFDEKYREALKGYVRGDEVIFKGECSSWGNWSNCELID